MNSTQNSIASENGKAKCLHHKNETFWQCQIDGEYIGSGKMCGKSPDLTTIHKETINYETTDEANLIIQDMIESKLMEGFASLDSGEVLMIDQPKMTKPKITLKLKQDASNTLQKLKLTKELQKNLQKIQAKAQELNVQLNLISADAILISGTEYQRNELVSYLYELNTSANQHFPNNENQYKLIELPIASLLKNSPRTLEKKAKDCNVVLILKKESMILFGRSKDLLEFLSWAVQVFQVKDVSVEQMLHLTPFQRKRKTGIYQKAEKLGLNIDIQDDYIHAMGSSKNIRILQTFLEDIDTQELEAYYPKYWDFDCNNSYTQIGVPPHSEEFKFVSDQFYKTMETYQIKNIYRIQRKPLINLYLSKVYSWKDVNYSSTAPYRQLLYFGAKKKVIEEIYQTSELGIATDYEQRRRNGLFFHSDARNAHKLIGQESLETNLLILADVLVGDIFKIFEGTIPPRFKEMDEYSTYAYNEGVYNIWFNHRSYPLYIIEYYEHSETTKITTDPEETKKESSIPLFSSVKNLMDRFGFLNNYTNFEDESVIETEMVRMEGRKMNSNKILNTLTNTRLAKEAQSLHEDLADTGIKVTPLSKNMAFWEAILPGLEGTPFEGIDFLISIEISDDYPFKAPIVKLLTKINHPNVFKDGSIFMDLLGKDWFPKYSLSSILIDLQSFLCNPDLTLPVNYEASKIYEVLDKNHLKAEYLFY